VAKSTRCCAVAAIDEIRQRQCAVGAQAPQSKHLAVLRQLPGRTSVSASRTGSLGEAGTLKRAADLDASQARDTPGRIIVAATNKQPDDYRSPRFAARTPRGLARAMGRGRRRRRGKVTVGTSTKTAAIQSARSAPGTLYGPATGSTVEPANRSR